jgi:hypothetical protein
MKQFLIERDFPGAEKLTPEELQEISQLSVTVISILGKPYNWIHSYVVKDKIYCIHEAENEEAIREHATCGNIPISKVQEIKTIISPATAEKTYA